MIVILDHQDSFTYNIYAALKTLGQDCVVLPTHSTEISAIERLQPSRLILSPGPGRPEEAQLFFEALKHYEKKIPILGICLGHQAIALHYGGKVIRSDSIVHGKPVEIDHNDAPIFKGLPKNFPAMRYNSLTVAPNLPEELELTATSNGEVMGLRHKIYNVEGLQFHPESIGTPEGLKILKNFAAQPS